MESTQNSSGAIVNVRDLLAMPTDQAERPKPLPPGHYYGTITGISQDKSKQKGTPFIRFAIKLEGPGEDVDPESVNGIDWTRKELRKDYYLTPTAVFRLSDALDAVQGAQSGRSYDERIAEMRGQRVLAQVTQRTSEDGSEVYNDVNKLLAAA